MRKALLLMTAAMMIGGSTLWGQYLDPSTLHIGPGSGTGCATGCGGDPNVISPTVLDIYQQSGGANATTEDPLLLILAIPNATDAFGGLDPISGVTFINAYPGGTSVDGSSNFATAGLYGLGTGTNGFYGSMGPGNDIYSFLFGGKAASAGMTNSDNFTNISTYDASIGVNATSFGIYVFTLSGAQLGPNGLVNVTFSNPLPVGTAAVAYGENFKKNGITVYTTPWTEAGDVGQVPEPGTLTLLGSGLLALGGLTRKLRRKAV